jgi:hypothetical protein
MTGVLRSVSPHETSTLLPVSPFPFLQAPRFCDEHLDDESDRARPCRHHFHFTIHAYLTLPLISPSSPRFCWALTDQVCQESRLGRQPVGAFHKREYGIRLGYVQRRHWRQQTTVTGDIGGSTAKPLCKEAGHWRIRDTRISREALGFI